jgi:hypothetical protein
MTPGLHANALDAAELQVTLIKKAANIFMGANA